MPVEFSDLPSEKSENKLNLKKSTPGENGPPIILEFDVTGVETGKMPVEFTYLPREKSENKLN